MAVDAEIDVGYAMSGDARLAFRVRAGGPHPIVWVAKWFAMQDLETPAPPQFVSGPWFARLLSFATVVSYDQRGTGLSDPVSLADLPTLETLADDLHAVITAAGLDDVVLWAPDEAGPVAVLYAATRPERTRALILVNSRATLARSEGYDAGVTPEDYERFVAWYERHWGTGRVLRAFLPDVSVDDARLRDLARFERQSMPPAVVGVILRWMYAIDVRAVLPAISAPTLVLHTENQWLPITHAQYLARHIPNARLVELPGADFTVFFGSASEEATLGEIEEFVTGTRMAVDHDRMLTTLMFTDVVGSTDRVVAIGDRAWHTVLDRHDDTVLHQLARFSGHNRSSPVTASSPPSTDPPAPSAAEPRSATPPARSASKSGSASTPVKSNDGAPNSPASPSTSPIASAKPHSPARCSCHGPSSISSPARAQPLTTAANTNSRASPPPGDSSPSLPKPTAVRRPYGSNKPGQRHRMP